MQRIRRHAWSLSSAQVVRWAWVPLLVGVLSACHLDMYDQPKADPYGQSDFFKDGASARPLEPGTIPNNKSFDEPLTTGKQNGEFLAQSPVQSSPELIAQGQAQYGIYCAPCHGVNGDSKGVAGGYFPQGRRPVSFYLESMRSSPDGYIFEVITNGKGLMYPYNTQIQNVTNRWAIVAYIRELQKNPPQGVDTNPTVQPTLDPNATPTATAQPGATPPAVTPTATP